MIITNGMVTTERWQTGTKYPVTMSIPVFRSMQLWFIMIWSYQQPLPVKGA